MSRSRQNIENAEVKIELLERKRDDLTKALHNAREEASFWHHEALRRFSGAIDENAAVVLVNGKRLDELIHGACRYEVCPPPLVANERDEEGNKNHCLSGQEFGCGPLCWKAYLTEGVMNE